MIIGSSGLGLGASAGDTSFSEYDAEISWEASNASSTYGGSLPPGGGMRITGGPRQGLAHMHMRWSAVQ